MLIYVKSVVIPKGCHEETIEHDLSDVTLANQFASYNQFFHVVKKEINGSHFYVDMQYFERTHLDSVLSTLYFLDTVTEDKLADTPPFSYIESVRYHDIHRVNYRAIPCRIGVDINTPLPVYYRKDLYLRRVTREVNYQQLKESCLVTVNGYVHLTDSDGSLLYVIDGGDTYLKSNDNQLGFLDFREVGKLSFHPFSAEQVINELFPNNEQRPLREKIILKTEADFANKSVFLVLGGYLIFLDYRWFYQSGEKEFTFIPMAVSLLNKLFESYNYLNLKSLGLDFSEQFPSRVSVNEFLSDEVLRKYFTLSQTFLVVVDTPTLYTQAIAINKGGYPGKFISYQEPQYPLIMNHGKIAEYWKVKEDKLWSVCVADSFLKNFSFGHNSPEQLNVVTDAQQPMMPFYESKGNLLQIFTRC